MKYSIILFVLFFVWACESEPSNEPFQSPDGCVLEKPDFVNEHSDTPETLVVPEEITSENLKALLLKPIDLPAYKKEFGPANSGGGDDEELFDVPDTIGFMYRYMLFHGLKRELPSHPSESVLFEKFSIQVYMFGESVGSFSDHNEKLMAIVCGIDNPTLGDLNVYGLSEKEIEAQFDFPSYKTDDAFIYELNNDVLSIHFNQETKIVDWFKYVRLNKSINLAVEIPSYLLEF